MDATIGQPVLRKEDLRLLTGQGRFSDDVDMPGQAFAAMVRSPHAHARIRNIETGAARAVPGVLAVLTGADLVADGLKPIPHQARPSTGPDITLSNRDGSEVRVTPHLPLPPEKVRFVGEAVVMVVGETQDAAKDGAQLVEVDYEVLPAVTATRQAASPGAPVVWDEFSHNRCVDGDVGDPEATKAAFAKAAKVTRLETWVRRVTGVPMEPRSAVAAFDPASGRYIVHAGSGGIVRQKAEIANILGVEPDMVKVTANDIGGNFGTRNSFFPEFVLAPWAARKVGRPVKWTADRSEALLTDFQGRDLDVVAELAMDDDGNFIALRGRNISNLGAHTASIVPLAKGVEIMSSLYRMPTAHFEVVGTQSNTPSTTPYRSAGRPEVIFVMERLVDLAARDHGFDPIELRRRNMITPEEMPYANPLGMTYDSGAYEQVMNRVVELADWDGYAARKAETERKGLRRGLGLAAYVETSTGNPRERTEMFVRPEGKLDVVIGTMSSGQGHETSFAQLAVEWLGVPFEDINLITHDTDIVPVGGGSHSGRSMRLAGIVMGEASNEIIDKGKRIASCVLEASEADIEFAGGRFTVAGTDRSIGLFEVAQAAEERDDLPEDLQGELSAECDRTVKIPAYPFGCHVCEVEVDAETGDVDIVRYAAVDDVGRAINPLILHGQAHGGIVQGLGQAFIEECVFDPATGQALAASFMDYGIPRADDVPSFVTEISEVPSPTNPLGIRAGGEGGTTPALAVLVNAIVDALWDLGVRHVEMPTTPLKVWQAIQDAKAVSR